MNSFKLKLFGGAVLEGEGGIVRGRAAHRRRLALLALLAVGRGRTVARERLIGYLWPESDGESARHLLSESLYVLRKVLGENVFISAGDEVGVDPAMLSTDLAAFEDAVACGALERAVEVYAGPFLDGFYVADAPDFERWAETERDRLARAYARALETLAAAREADGRWTEAVEWARRLFAHDPFNSRTTLRLMTALDAAGERGAALKVAAAHTTLMRDELQAEPEPAVLGLAERLRAEPAPVPELPSRPAGHLLRLATAAGEGVGVEGAEPALAVATANPATDVAPSTPPTPRRSARAASLRPGWRMAAAGLAIAVAAAAWTLTARDPAATGVSVAVFPLESAAGVPPTVDPAELRRLFSNAFTLVPGLWTVDVAVPEGARGWREASLDALRRRARATGARYLAVPEILSAAPLRISCSVREVRSWELVGSYSSEPGEPVAGAVQRLGLMLARAVATRERLGFTPVSYLLGASDSTAALGQFLLATSLFKAGDSQTAAREFRRAIAADPAFLLASHRLSVVETFPPNWNFAAARQAVDNALTRRALGRPIDVELLAAQRHFVMREGSAAVERFTRVTVNDPSLLDGWFGKGEAIFHHQGLLGGSPTDALDAFETVVRMDSAFSPAYHHLVEIAVRLGDEERARRYAARVRSPREGPAYALAVAMRFGSHSERAAAFAAVDTAPRNTVSNLVSIFAHDPNWVDTLGAVLMRRSGADRLQGAQYRLAALAALGRWPRGLSLWERNAAPPDRFDKWIVHAHLAGFRTPQAEAMLRRARLEIAEQGGPDFTATSAASRDRFRALVHLNLLTGDSADVRWLLERLEGPAREADPSNPEPGGLRESLRAREALLAGDTTRAIEYLQRSLARAPWWVSSWAPLADAAPQRLLLARLLGARGERREAERWLESFGKIGAVGDLMYAEPVQAAREALRPPPAQRRPVAGARR